jgi:crotonobetainyl-CoA:carnitine CoA-transferase CaiB-like acyl-CoA transferase
VSEGVLDGIRVLDLTRNFAGPFCTQTLGDLGAEVIKVEQPGRGDDSRAWTPPAWGEESASYLSANRNKRSIAVDLDRPAGAEIVRSLARRADVLVESFRPGSLDKRGLGWEQLRGDNERLVYCSISAFGQEGPMRDSPGYDPVLQAYTGIMHITGEPGGPPVRLGVGALDLGSAMWATIGIFTALRERDQTGRGSRVDTSLLETATHWLSYHLGGFLATGVDPRPQGTTTGFIAPYESFPTGDGAVFVATPNDNLYRAFMHALELPELVDDPRFADNPSRVANRDELRSLIVSRMATRTAVEWEQVLRAASVPCTRVRTVAELATDDQLAAIDLVHPLPHPTVPDLQVVDLPFRVEGKRAAQWLPPPMLGQHTDDILRELDYDDTTIASLRADGTVA